MVIDAFFDNSAVYNVFYKIDVTVGQKFTLVMDNPSEMEDVYVNNDKVLSHEHNGTDINIEALSVGVSKVRIMKVAVEGQNPIVRELLINVLNQISRPASDLGLTAGQPEPK